MRRKINITGLTLFFTLALFSLAFSEESLTITTYYPSPYGSYNELSTNIFNLEPQSSQPINKEGRLYYDSDTRSIFYYNGTEWGEIPILSTANPLVYSCPNLEGEQCGTSCMGALTLASSCWKGVMSTDGCGRTEAVPCTPIGRLLLP